MTLVSDKGCNSPENLSGIYKSKFYFVGTLSTYHPKLCRIPLSDYEEERLMERMKSFFMPIGQRWRYMERGELWS